MGFQIHSRKKKAKNAKKKAESYDLKKKNKIKGKYCKSD